MKKKKNKRQKRSVFFKIVTGLFFLAGTLCLAAVFVPVSSKAVTDFINKKISEELNTDFKAQKADIFIFRQVTLSELDLVYNVISLKADKAKINFNLLSCLIQKNTPVNILLENVRINCRTEDSSLDYGTVFQLWQMVPGFLPSALGFDTVKMDFNYSPEGIELGNLSAESKRLNVAGQGQYGTRRPVNYQLELSLLSPVLNGLNGYLSGVFMPGKIPGKTKGKRVICVELKGSCQSPAVCLITRAGRVPLKQIGNNLP